MGRLVRPLRWSGRAMLRLLRWALPLLAMAGTIYAVWRFYFQTQDVSAAQDPWVWVGIGVAYLIAVFAILVTTDYWSLRGLGQVATYVADMVFYLGIGSAQYHWRHALTLSDVNIGRAALVVGGSLLVFGLIWYGLTALFAWRVRRAVAREHARVLPQETNT